MKKYPSKYEQGISSYLRWEFFKTRPLVTSMSNLPYWHLRLVTPMCRRVGVSGCVQRRVQHCEMRCSLHCLTQLIFYVCKLHEPVYCYCCCRFVLLLSVYSGINESAKDYGAHFKIKINACPCCGGTTQIKHHEP